jgi:uncharacterized SAM-binding protein YcdF (DUF218 family)
MMDKQILKHAQVLWDFHHVNHVLRSCDLILVLGSHDRRVADYAASLWHKNLAPQVLCTGGIAHQQDLMATGWNRSEAEVFAERMVAAGVPVDKIWLEPEAKNTGDNFNLSRALLEAKGCHVKEVIAVTKPYMERRVLATGQVRWPDVNLMVASQPCTLEEYLANSQKSPEVDVNVMVGDLQRLKLYPAQGFMAPTVIPDDVWASFEALVTLGFDKHLVK